MLDVRSVEELTGGQIVNLPRIRLRRTNLFFGIGVVGSVFVKLPTRYALAEHRDHLDDWGTSADDVRGLEEEERFDKLPEALDRFPPLKDLRALGDYSLHYLVLHMQQYQRLKAQCAVAIPQARFGAVRSRRGWVIPRLGPAIFQEAIHGTTL